MWMARSSLSWQPWSPLRARSNSFTNTSSVCSPPREGRMKKGTYMYINTGCTGCGVYTHAHFNYKLIATDLYKE